MHPTSLPLLHFDANPDAVINPFRDEGYQFPQRMLFAFISAANILKFVEQYPHTIVGTFETVSNEFHVYQLDVDGHQVGLCRAPLGASAATQLLEFLIAYGAQRIVTVGSCGVLTDAPENQFMVVTAALRDEGTSFHYLPPAPSITLDADVASHIQAVLTQHAVPVHAVQTWTTDAFFRETRSKVAAHRAAGYTVVEMECAALAACARFRGAQFGQILFAGDSLAAMDEYVARDFGKASHLQALRLGCWCLM